MERRKFLNMSAAAAGGLMTSAVVNTGQHAQAAKTAGHGAKISELKKNTAIAMWDFSWILRHHRYGEFENWDEALEGHDISN